MRSVAVTSHVWVLGNNMIAGPILSVATLLLVAGAGTTADLQYCLSQRLEGGSATVADCQRELATLLGRRAETASGLVALGQDVAARDLDVACLDEEWSEHPEVYHFVEVQAQGPDPIRILTPKSGAAKPVALYRRASRGLFVRMQERPRWCGRHDLFEVTHPGVFVVCDKTVPPDIPSKSGLLFDFTPTTSDPAARGDWGLWRVRQQDIQGAVPVILVHGLTNDRWGEFIHWARSSPEAQEFREAFQLWDFYHGGEGIDAPVGYSPEFASFDESIIAYLDRFIRAAQEEGVVTNGVRYYFPEGPFLFVTHSTGGPKLRAFLKNFPEYLERVLAVVSVAAPHVGTPGATPEWLRYTFARLSGDDPPLWGRLLAGGLAEFFTGGFMRTDRQSDLDAGWGNFDAQGGFGIPTDDFEIWRPCQGIVHGTVSPRDANQTWAPWLPDIDDTTFEPPERRATYCGGLDEIMPEERGQYGLDRFFLYGAYIDEPKEWFGLVQRGKAAYQEPGMESCLAVTLQNLGLRMAQLAFAQVATAGSAAPLGVYSLNDGITPLQSALMLDGKETELIYETELRGGYRYPVLPYRHREDLIRAHTLADPGRLRILKGWTHLDTITGRYDQSTGHSELFTMIADDLLSVLP